MNKALSVISVLGVNLLLIIGYIDSWLKYSFPAGYENRYKKEYAFMTIVFMILIIHFNFFVIR